jgi:hypothetical protein
MMNPAYSILYDLNRARNFPLKRIETQRPGRLIIEYVQGGSTFIHVSSYDILMRWLSGMAWLLEKAPIVRIEQ